MKKKQKIFFIILTGLFLAFSASACTDKDSGPALECPFTEIGWDATPAEVVAIENAFLNKAAGGNEENTGASTYDSVYGGLCYTWPKEYNGLMGTVKYMFDAEDRLMCVAWAYGCTDENELFSLYESISNSVNASYGESGYAADHPGNYGNVWYLETGDIVLTTMITTENKALQYAYLHPLVSNKPQSSGD